MIRLFDVNDRTFTSNGDVVLKPRKARVHNEDNGDYYLEIETGLEYSDVLTAGRIIVANTPKGDQAFRISEFQKTKSRIRLKAWHVYYDSENYLIADSYVVEKNCGEALAHLNNATEPVSEFTTDSTVWSVNSYRCVRKSLYEAINTVLERWGGHLIRDNFNIEIGQSIGTDNGVTVRYAKNLKDITCDTNWNTVVTKLLPVGKDGFLLPELYVTSETQYAIPFTKSVSFTQDINQEDYDTEDEYQHALEEDLRTQAQAYVDGHCLPQANYTLKADLERITDVGDVVAVIDERLGVNLLTNVISYDYDCILEKYTEVEFGNFQKKLSDLMGSIASTTEQVAVRAVDVVKDTLQQSITQATQRITGNLGGHIVIMDTDMDGTPDELLILGDSDDYTTAQKVWRWNSSGLGYSSTGYNGSYGLAMTSDGEIVADFITTGTLNADLIRAGHLDAQYVTVGDNKELGNYFSVAEEGGVVTLTLGDGSNGMVLKQTGSKIAFCDTQGNELAYWTSNTFILTDRMSQMQIGNTLIKPQSNGSISFVQAT